MCTRVASSAGLPSEDSDRTSSGSSNTSAVPEAWPAPGRIWFGKIIAPRIGAAEDVAARIDASVAGSYKDRLWSNN